MIKVIETNLLIDDSGNITDHQARIIEVESWDGFIYELISGVAIIRKSYIGDMYGCSRPRQSRIENLVHDDFHLSCDVYNWNGAMTKKFVYLIREAQ